MTRDARLAKLEQVLGPESVTVRLIRVPHERSRDETPLSAAEVVAYTDRIVGPFRVAR